MITQNKQVTSLFNYCVSLLHLNRSITEAKKGNVKHVALQTLTDKSQIVSVYVS